MEKDKYIVRVLEEFDYDPIKLAQKIIDLRNDLLDSNEQIDLLMG